MEADLGCLGGRPVPMAGTILSGAVEHLEMPVNPSGSGSSLSSSSPSVIDSPITLPDAPCGLVPLTCPPS